MQSDPVGAVASNWLDCYEAIAAASREMLVAAREGNWEEVARIERRVLERVDQVKSAMRVRGLRADEQERRMSLLRSILANDAEIERLAEPSRAQIESWLLPQRRPARTD